MSIGTSTVYSTIFVVECLRSIKPRSILDVGCGWGRWGFLAREFLELWEQRYDRADWEVDITALDIHAGTWTPVHDFVYDRHLTQDVRTWGPGGLGSPDRFDVTVITDVLEHMTRQESFTVVDNLLDVSDNVILGTPVGTSWPERGGTSDNPHEAHLQFWNPDDLRRWKNVRTMLVVTEDGLPYGLAHLRP